MLVIAGVGIKVGYIMWGAHDNKLKPPHSDSIKLYDPTEFYDPNTQNNSKQLIDPSR